MLTLLLPIGSQPGAYEAQLHDVSGVVVASASGRADIRNFVTTLDVTLDVPAAATGVYQLAAHRDDEDWHLFPVTVR